MAIQLNFKCNESWQQMPTAIDGRFCNKCAKNVLDLTNKSDAEIKQLYAENNGKMCGRIKSTQLTVYPFISEKKKLLAKFCFALYLVFGSLLFNGQVVAQNNVSETIEQNQREAAYIIKGLVTDKETNEPIPFVNVFLEGSNPRVVMTDENGKYKLELYQEDLNFDGILISFEGLGYKRFLVKDILLRDQKHILVSVKLDEEFEMLLGDIEYIPEEPPLINKDPNSHGETIIKGEDLRKSPH